MSQTRPLKHIIEGKVTLLNWNIGGAKYLELKPENSPKRHRGEQCREEFRRKLNEALLREIEDYDPAVLTLQEVVEYEPDGHVERRMSVIDPPPKYHYYPYMLIDTLRHSHQGKWNKVRNVGEWSEQAFFAQGNAILVHREKVPHFPLWSLPDINQNHEQWVCQQPRRYADAPGQGCMEMVALESGLYFGNRNTEPRAALVVHLVLSSVFDQELPKPLDVFVVNLHLTTLMMEREGIPAIDQAAADTRMSQLNIVLNGVISRYNEWRAQKFRIRGEYFPPSQKDGHRETHERLPPIWVIAGDFNFTPESVEYETLVRKGFIDIGKGPTKAKGLGNPPSITLDYVFAGPRFEAIEPNAAVACKERSIVVDHVRVSDHFPLVAYVPITVEVDDAVFRRSAAAT
jgi:endonuclease/exonuclease/phosphatase family metal-dependent hydrolase